jgi:hypothetical protein
MNRSRFRRDPLDRLTRADKRSWRASERRAVWEHDRDQLVALLGLAAAGGGVTGLRTPPEEGDVPRPAPPVEMIIEGRRVRAGRIPRRTVAKLREAVTSIAAVPLTAVSRYGPYWVLTFKLATEQLVVLVDQLTLLPDWSGPGGRDRVPVGPLASLGA